MTPLTKGQQRVREIAAEFIPRFEEQGVIPENEHGDVPSDDELCIRESLQMVERLASDKTIREDSITGAMVGGGRFGERLFPVDYLQWLWDASDHENTTADGNKQYVVPTALPTLTNIAFRLPDSKPAYEGGWKSHTTMPVLVCLARGDQATTHGRTPATYYRGTGILEVQGNNHRLLAHVLFGKRELDLPIYYMTERIEPPQNLAENFLLAEQIITEVGVHDSPRSDAELEEEARTLQRFSDLCAQSEESDELDHLAQYWSTVKDINGRGWLDGTRAAENLSTAELLCEMLVKRREVLNRGRLDAWLREKVYWPLIKQSEPPAFERWLIRQREMRR